MAATAVNPVKNFPASACTQVLIPAMFKGSGKGKLCAVGWCIRAHTGTAG